MGQRNGFRIPTILAIALVGGLITITSLLSDDARLLFGRAAQPSHSIPQNVTVANISDSSALIYWKSEDAIASTIRYASRQDTQVLYDHRDTDKTPKSYKLHVFSITSLAPSQTTPFEIYNGNQPVYKGTVTTGPRLEKPSRALPLYGTVPAEVLDSEKGVLVSVIINNEARWTTFQYSNPSWVLPLAAVRTSDLSAFYCSEEKCEDSIPLTFEFISESSTISRTATIGASRPFSEEQALVKGEPTQVVTPTSTSLPAPTLVASPTARLLTRSTTVPSPTKKLTITPSPAQKVLSVATQSGEITIISPKEGALLSFPRPLIRGTGVPEKIVTVTLTGAVTQIGKTTVNEKGLWQWTPGYPLAAGTYKLSITTTNKVNRKITLTRSFRILKSGENVLSASTPSATLIPVPTEVPIDTPPIEPPTATPTLYVTAGPAVSLFFVGGGAMLLLLALTIL